MESHLARQLRFGSESFGGGQNLRVDLDGLQHRPPPALPPHRHHRVADVGPDLQDVSRLLRPHQHAKQLRDFRIGDRMLVLAGKLLHALEQRIARWRESFEILGLLRFENGVGAGFHSGVRRPCRRCSTAKQERRQGRRTPDHFASTASFSCSAWKWEINGSRSTSRLPFMMLGRLCTVSPMRWSVTRS